MSLRRFSCLLISALAVSVFVAMYVAKHRILTEQSQPFGRYDSRQILARTRRLCALLTAQANGLRLSASQLEFPGEPPRRFWAVDCTDDTGNFVAYFTWEAESGALYSAGHRSSTLSEQGAAPLSHSEAVQIARRWMSALGIAEQASQWRLAHPPEQIRAVWHIAWQAEGRAAFIEIDCCSGDLLQAKNWRQNEQRAEP